MAELPSGKALSLPIWCIKMCKWLWKKQKFFWGTLILSIVLNVLASLLLFKWPWVTNANLNGTVIQWAFENAYILLLMGIILLLLLVIIYLGSRFEIDNVASIEKADRDDNSSSELNGEVSKYYLERMIRSNETLTLKGIPAGLIDKGAQLDEVFISLQFRSNRPLVEYPVTEKERNKLRKILEGGLFDEEMERILFEAERTWYNHNIQNERITLIDLWKKLTISCPAAVIQGFPGMGKSTLMARMTVHMARGSLVIPDPTMPYQLEPKLIPIFLSLGRYASELDEAKKCNQSLSLVSYLERTLQDLNISGLIPFIQAALANGTCLILLDGLDEVSDHQTRKEVQEAIRNFILAQSSSTDGMNSYNRFLITSRVAGYDQNAFPTYEHFAIAELTPEQVKDFILRWCRANARRDYGSMMSSQSEGDEPFTKEAEIMESKLVKVVLDHEGVKELAENPLLLTLLAVMQQNSVELPRERVELYKAVTSTLLENRNIAKGLPTIPEAQAVQRLGPIAFQMQETANSFLRRSEVLASLKQTILLEEGGTTDQVTQEAESFLSRIRERSGIFVLRTADYFGFFHRTFQEYFAARYVLNQIKNNSDYWIPEFAKRASCNDVLWREPFLLAVAYKSSDDEITARQLINTLLKGSNESDIESRCHDLLLAIDCLIEAKPLTLGLQLEQQVAIKLLQFYEEVQRCQDEEEETCEQQEEVCNQVERAIWRWLVSLPKESYRPAVVVVLCDALSDIQDVARQRLILVLLAT